MNLAETETTLRVLHVFKGQVLSQQIRFRYYDTRGYILMGPPQGPSGRMGDIGIFFLVQHSDDVFRSAVDVFRPDIATPWSVGLPEEVSCAAPADCIARFLLTYYPSDDAASFSNHIGGNMGISRTLIGFLNTFDLLNTLVESTHPEVVRRQACLELARGYALEQPAVCKSMISGTPTAHEVEGWAANILEALRNEGAAYVRQRIGTDDELQVRRYILLLARSSDDAIRRVARNILRDIER